MKRKSVIYNCFIFLLLAITSQSHSQALPDSIQSRLQFSNDSSRVETYIQLAEATMSENPDLALDYVKRAEKLSVESNDPVLIGKVKNKIGIAYYHLDELDQSTTYYFEALTLFDSVDYQEGKVRALNNIAWNYRVQDRQEESIKIFLQSMEIAEKIGDPQLLQVIYNNLGTAYRNTGEPEKALKKFNQSLEMNRQLGNRKWEAFNYNNIGLAQKDLGNYQEAKTSFYLARDLNLELGNQTEYINNLLNLGDLYRAMAIYDSAEMYLDFALPLIENSNMQRTLFSYYDYKADLSEQLNDYEKALEFHRSAVSIEKDLNKIEINEKLSKLQAKYNNVQKVRELEASERKINQQRMVIIGGASLFFLLLGILFLVLQLYKSKNRWGQNVESLNEEISQKNEELQSMNEEIQEINNNLEQLVEDRTRKIKKQNEKLVKYAFINSHEIRGPLARVLGLLYLMGLEKKEIHEEESFKLLNEATNELDDVIKGASELLEGEDITIETKEEQS